MGDQLTNTRPIPPFLFRAASSDKSRGINTVNEIDPLRGRSIKYHTDLEHLESPDYSKARHMVRNHIQYNYKFPSEFSSWSVSLLYVLVHASRKKYQKEKDVLIYVMDTSKLTPSRIHAARDLLKKYGLQGWMQLMEYAQGEFLLHGHLSNTDNLWKAVSLDLIVDNLWYTFPGLKNPEFLASRVRQLREEYFDAVYGIGPKLLNRLRSLTAPFGATWEAPIMIALLAIQQRNLSAESITDLFFSLDVLQAPALPWTDDMEKEQCNLAQEIPEAEHFVQLLRPLYEKRMAFESHGYKPTFVQRETARRDINSTNVSNIGDQIWKIAQDKDRLKALNKAICPLRIIIPEDLLPSGSSVASSMAENGSQTSNSNSSSTSCSSSGC